MTVIDGLATLVLLGFSRAHWLFGVWGAAAWFWLNAYLLWRITAWAPAGGQPPTQSTVLKWCLVKFPVLYLIGLGFLMIPGVRLGGVFVTFTAFLIGLAAALYIGIDTKAVKESKETK